MKKKADTERKKSQEIFEVDAILNKKIQKSQTIYLVKWKGYDSDEATWEPETNLIGCSSIIAAFEKGKKHTKSDDINNNNSKKKTKEVRESSPEPEPRPTPKRTRDEKPKNSVIQAKGMTYGEMIDTALRHFGGSATSTDIVEYISVHYPEEVAQKTTTWKNSVCGQLSSKYNKSGERDGKALWSAPDKVSSRKPKSFPSETKRTKSSPKSDSKNENKPEGKEPKEAKEPKEHKEHKESKEAKEPKEHKDHKEPKEPKEAKESKEAKNEIKKPPQKKQKIEHKPKFNANTFRTSIVEESETFHCPIQWVNSANALSAVKKLPHAGDIYSMACSKFGAMVCTVGSLAIIKIWDTKDFNLLAEIRDKTETHIESFTIVQWCENDKFVFAAGALKDRNKWDSEQEDNKKLPSPIKVFDVVKAEVILRLEGHTNEVLDIKLLTYNEEKYVLSSGNDGKIIKWRLTDDYTKLEEMTEFTGHVSETCASLSFFPHTGNRYFACCCDTGLKVFDFETAQFIESFPDLYTSLCDSAKFLEEFLDQKVDEEEFYILTKGVEEVDEKGVIEKPNSVHLRKITFSKDGLEMETLKQFSHKDYHSNIWPARLNTNGRYVFSPTSDGKVFAWNIRTGQLTAVLQVNTDAIRDIVFHPGEKLMIFCGDDGLVSFYEQKSEDDRDGGDSPNKKKRK